MQTAARDNQQTDAKAVTGPARKAWAPDASHGIKMDTDGQGTARIYFAQLNVADKDGDVTLPGAFIQGQQVKVCQYGHKWGELPAGGGVIREEGDWAIADLKFFLDTPQGDAMYRTLKAVAEAGLVQEWSYGFNILEAGFGDWEGKHVRFLKALDTFEVSPVLLGAGIGTHTADIKSADADAKASDCGACSAPSAASYTYCPGCGQAKASTPAASTDAEEVGGTDNEHPKALSELVRFQSIRARANGVDI